MQYRVHHNHGVFCVRLLCISDAGRVLMSDLTGLNKDGPIISVREVQPQNMTKRLEFKRKLSFSIVKNTKTFLIKPQNLYENYFFYCFIQDKPITMRTVSSIVSP